MVVFSLSVGCHLFVHVVRRCAVVACLAMWLVEVATLEAILFSSRRQIRPNGRAENRYASGWLFAISLGCGTPIWMSARQNTQKNTADRLVYTRGSGKLVWSTIWPEQGRHEKSKFRKMINFSMFWAHLVGFRMVSRVGGVFAQSVVLMAGKASGNAFNWPRVVDFREAFFSWRFWVW